MDLSIIIVNWKSVRYLEKCLETVYHEAGTLAIEVIVIDNASYDGSDAMIGSRFPQVRFIQSAGNLGFAGANNVAYRVSVGKTLLFLNPDTEIIGRALLTMHRLLWENPKAGIIGCTLLNTDGTVQTSCVQAFPTIVNQAVNAEMLRHSFPLLRLWGNRALFERNYSPASVEVVSGACLMIKRAAFERVGLFSTEYFMYAEDADLCSKVRNLGFAVLYTKDASVVHHGGGCSRQSETNYFSDVVICESIFRLMAKFNGKVYGLLYRAVMAGVALARIFLIFCLRAVRRKERARRVLGIALGKWIKILRWSLGAEKWAGRLRHELRA